MGQIQALRRQLLIYALAHGAFRFGSFPLKSKRISPYYFDSSVLCEGDGLALIGEVYSEMLSESGQYFDALYGVPCRGTVLAVAAAVALSTRQHKSVGVSSHREKEKDHGVRDRVYGSSLSGKTLVLVDDTMTTALSFEESVEVIAAHREQPVGIAALALTFDRQECTSDGLSVMQKVQDVYGVRVVIALTLTNVLDFIETEADRDSDLVAQARHHADAMHRYQEEYCV